MPQWQGLRLIRRNYLKLAVVLLLVATLSLLSSILFQVHAGNKATAYQVFDISFYYFVPFFLWLIYLPFVDLLAKKMANQRS